jgi:hypothetical protein
MPTSTYAVLAIYVAFGLLELFRTRLFSKNEQTRNDGIVEVISTVLLLVFTQPAILIFVDYALGALRAVRWLDGRAPGVYDMQDVLGLRER